MDGSVVVTGDHVDPPERLLERLRQIAGYAWDDGRRPFHSSYDNWHLFGTRFVSPYSTSSASNSQQNVTSPPVVGNKLAVPIHRHASDSSSDRSGTTPPAAAVSSGSDASNVEEQPIVARVSYHVLREERSFHLCKNLIATDDPNGDHVVKPVDLFRLAPQPGDRGAIIVAIYEFPGPNHIFRLMDLGPAFYFAKKVDDRLGADIRDNFHLDKPISLEHFLDFAIGATQCLEILHHRHAMVHGELRGDAFHYNLETGRVKLTSFGSGVRSFEHGLTSTGWSTLSKEIGAKHKLVYISPEQTGRMPAEPDTRTDIYSLGVVFWQLLTQQQVFTGATPLDIVQSVLGHRIPLVSSIRQDVPEILARIIQKCTSKNIQDRFHSVRGLRHDLQMVQKFMMEGDSLALKSWRLGSEDFSSFFMLPTFMIGRDKERQDLIKVIERVAMSHAISNVNATNRYSDSNLPNDVLDTGDVSSEGASSVEGQGNRRSGSFTQNLPSDPRASRSFIQTSVNGVETQTLSGETMSSTQSNRSGNRLTRAWERHQSIQLDNKSLVDSFSDRQPSRMSNMETTTSLSRQLGSAKFRRRGHCEVVMIEGAGGLGKSFLVQQVLAEARSRGYCATSKFDTARRHAFGPLLKLLSSLFKQVWGERNTETPLHLALKDYVRPIWPMLHKMLGLPEFLLGPQDPLITRSVSSAQSPSKGRNLRTAMRRRGSSPGSSPNGFHSPRISSQSSQDFLLGGASTKTIRLMNTFLDILRIFSTYHFICFCLDDLHFADDESLELITQMIAARLKMLVIVTYRPDELSPERISKILSPADSEEHPKSSGPRITKMVLSPLDEKEILQYVASTLCRQPEDLAPLALVIQSKTAGNPFYIREMLNACYRSKTIWYDYHESRWMFDLDKLFEQFKGEHDYEVLDSDFITRRLSELPSAARSILAWASLLGSSFSFDIVCKFLTGEYDYVEEEVECSQDAQETHFHQRYSKTSAVAGLNATVTACIIVQGETDDRFRFAHDRYIQAASSLKECNKRKMHFIIAQTLLKHYGFDSGLRDNTASHICESVDVIKSQVAQRKAYRKHLMAAATAAVENGARPTAAKYYSYAMTLLQSNPWGDGKDDSYYEETHEIYMRAAECHVFMGNNATANDLLDRIFANAKSSADKAPAWLLQSRVLAQSGDARSALASLKQSLTHLKVDFDEHPTFEKCDAEFMRLSAKIKTMERLEPTNLVSVDPQLAIIGAMLADACTAAWWSDTLDYFNLSLTMIRLHVEKGYMPQSGMAFLQLAMIALSRFNMVEFAAELGNQCVELLDRLKDPFASSRGYMLYACFVSHVQFPISVAVNHLAQATEYAASAGDRTSVVISFGLAAQMRFYASENYADLEATCQYCCEEIPSWHLDTRGGTFLLAVRQICRALQGKTQTSDPLEVMSDQQHSSSAYKSWLEKSTNNGGRSVFLYQTMEIVALYLYGHHEHAYKVGKQCYENIDLVWSARNTRLVILFYGLALAGLTFRKLGDPRLNPDDMVNEIMDVTVQLETLSKKIKDWQVVSDVNYLVWSKWLDAQIAELRKDHGAAISLYETALDHAAEHSFTFEEALGNYLMAGFFIRQTARRSARAVLKESVGLWQLLGATGIAHRIEEEHVLLMNGPAQNTRNVEVGVQTDFVADTSAVAVYAAEREATVPGARQAMAESKATRTAAWRGSMQPESGAGLPALDMIDLHAILVSSQVISSVLQKDELLKTMCDVILQTCGGSASQAAIIVQEEDSQPESWCIAASGEPERGAVSHNPGHPLSGTSLVAENVILYCVRFREAVFIPDLIADERFGNVSSSWLMRNPLSRAVIAIPICHGTKPLLGVLYMEGEPGAFTDRSMTVLQLLVNQIGISYSNALSLKNIEKVSAENVSIIEMQKKAVLQAQAAEAKAKDAEAEALRNVKIAEEAAKAKGIFLANVSHELRTPLNGVIGNSELLRDSELNREQLEMAESIRVSADLLLTVINDILDFSKMEADKMKLYVIAFNPNEMITEVVRAVSYSNREKAAKKNVKIIQDINLPAILIYGDPIRLHQVLGNLIGNSLKFTDSGSITIGARIDADTQEYATLTFWVRDTGIGIPPKQLANLFKPFSQADASTARKYGGSGLGLSICRSLIETMMKGRIELESEEGVGTTAWFTVTFDKAKPEASAGDVQALPSIPVTDRVGVPPATSPVQDKFVNPYMDLSKIPKDELRICVAEDNLINQRIAIQFVKKLGYKKVDAYENGMKTVEGLREQASQGRPYHVVLMDVQMPVLDGYEATKLLRKDPIEEVRKVLVIAMTASAISGDREKCLAAGMNDYLAKPVKADLLKRKLDTYITGHSTPASPLSKSPSPSNNSAYTHSPTPPLVSQDSGGRNAADSSSQNNVVDGKNKLAQSDTPSTSPPLRSSSNGVTSNSPPGTIAVSRESSYVTASQGLSRTSSDNRSLVSDQGSMTDSLAATVATQKDGKRQPRKLTKNPKPDGADKPEKPKSLLKKGQRVSMTSVAESPASREAAQQLSQAIADAQPRVALQDSKDRLLQ